MFNIGDEVMVSYSISPNTYVFTKPGSIGVITEILNDDLFRVKFSYLTGVNNEYYPEGYHHYHFTEWDHFELVCEAPKPYVMTPDNPNYKYQKIVNKIKQMESKRKAKGYAY